jgi:hypothetical protein
MTGQQTGRPAGKHNCQNPADGFLKNEIAKAKKVTIVKILLSKTLHWQLQAKAQKQPITKQVKLSQSTDLEVPDLLFCARSVCRSQAATNKC